MQIIRLLPLLLVSMSMAACGSKTRAPGPTTTSPPPPTATARATLLPSATPKPSPTPRPTATPFQSSLTRMEKLPERCHESPMGLPGEGLIEVAYIPSGFCMYGELDLFETGGQLYVVQSLLDARPSLAPPAFVITDVTDSSQASIIGAWQWNAPTYTADVKTFRQGERWYLAVSRQPASFFSGVCLAAGGLVVVEVTDPANPQLIGVFTGSNTGSAQDWCSPHTVQVSHDANGDGAYLYASTQDTFDLHVLDIRDLDHVTEAGHYAHPEAGFHNQRDLYFVHDTTIAGDRVYVAYWSAGLIILDRRKLEAGESVTPLNPLDSIAPFGLDIHHAFPTVDGQFVFVEDEVNFAPPQSQLRMYDIRDLAAPRKVAAISLDDPFSAPHNLLVSGDLLFVGWYSDGVRVFKYDTSDPDHPSVEPYAFKAVRAKRTVGIIVENDIYDGIWGVRLHDCVLGGQPQTCVYASDLTRGLIILALEP